MSDKQRATIRYKLRKRWSLCKALGDCVGLDPSRISEVLRQLDAKLVQAALDGSEQARDNVRAVCKPTLKLHGYDLEEQRLLMSYRVLRPKQRAAVQQLMEALKDA